MLHRVSNARTVHIPHPEMLLALPVRFKHFVHFNAFRCVHFQIHASTIAHQLDMANALQLTPANALICIRVMTALNRQVV